MRFVHKNKRAINAVLIISMILDIFIGFIINKISDAAFNLRSTHNIVLLVIFVVAIIALICCKLIETSSSTRLKNKKLQKAFQDNGGYEAVVDEMKSCIKKHDLKSLKELKKMVDLIEK